MNLIKNLLSKFIWIPPDSTFIIKLFIKYATHKNFKQYNFWEMPHKKLGGITPATALMICYEIDRFLNEIKFYNECAKELGN